VTERSKDLVLYRMARADETLEDARILARAERWNACENRLYYACFCAIAALLIHDGLSSSKRAGIRGLFNRQYVKTGKLPKDLARIYNDLFERRQEGDYIDFVSFQESQVLPWFSKAEELIDYVAGMIRKQIDVGLKGP
jgi:uncharacterized protein (UPF0332 family)